MQQRSAISLMSYRHRSVQRSSVQRWLLLYVATTIQETVHTERCVNTDTEKVSPYIARPPTLPPHLNKFLQLCHLLKSKKLYRTGGPCPLMNPSVCCLFCTVILSSNPLNPLILFKDICRPLSWLQNIGTICSALAIHGLLLPPSPVLPTIL